MADVSTPRALLIMAVQDLYDAERAMVERLGGVCANVRDDGLSAIIERDRERSEDRCETLAGIARPLDADPSDADNIWLRAILDDADNDASTIEPGPLLDIALAGALRKGKQSQRVSYETAVALAQQLDMPDAAQSLKDIAAADGETDAALGEALRRLCGTL